MVLVAQLIMGHFLLLRLPTYVVLVIHQLSQEVVHGHGVVLDKMVDHLQVVVPVRVRV